MKYPYLDVLSTLRYSALVSNRMGRQQHHLFIVMPFGFKSTFQQ